MKVRKFKRKRNHARRGAALLAFAKRMKVRQRKGLTQMMRATQRMGLYEAELEGLWKK
jgi:hypothetical protein